MANVGTLPRPAEGARPGVAPNSARRRPIMWPVHSFRRGRSGSERTRQGAPHPTAGVNRRDDRAGHRASSARASGGVPYPMLAILRGSQVLRTRQRAARSRRHPRRTRRRPPASGPRRPVTHRGRTSPCCRCRLAPNDISTTRRVGVSEIRGRRPSADLHLRMSDAVVPEPDVRILKSPPERQVMPGQWSGGARRQISDPRGHRA